MPHIWFSNGWWYCARGARQGFKYLPGVALSARTPCAAFDYWKRWTLGDNASALTCPPRPVRA